MKIENFKDELISFLIPLIVFLVAVVTCICIYDITRYELWLELSIIFTMTTLLQAILLLIRVARTKEEPKEITQDESKD